MKIIVQINTLILNDNIENISVFNMITLVNAMCVCSEGLSDMSVTILSKDMKPRIKIMKLQYFRAMSLTYMFYINNRPSFLLDNTIDYDISSSHEAEWPK